MRRTWQLGPFEDDAGNLIPLPDADRDREMMHLGWTLDRMGGSAVIAPLRIKEPSGYTTVGLGIKYDSGTMPAVDVPRGETQEPPIPEPPSPAPGELTAEEMADHFPAASDSSTSDEAAPSEEPVLAGGTA